MKQPSPDLNDDDEECRPWRRRFTMAFSWSSALRITLLLLLLAAVIAACFTLPIEKVPFFSHPFPPSLPFRFWVPTPISSFFIFSHRPPNWICIPGISVYGDVLNLFHVFVLQIMKDFLLWVDHDLGAWGPLVL